MAPQRAPIPDKNLKKVLDPNSKCGGHETLFVFRTYGDIPRHR